MESSGGGGFGDPLERDPALVVADVAEAEDVALRLVHRLEIATGRKELWRTNAAPGTTPAARPGTLGGQRP